jgi:hypothetical protein
MTHAAEPLDVETMQETAERVCRLGATPAARDDLALLVQTMRGDIRLLVPEVRALAHRMPAGCVAAQVALIGADEAERRLAARAGFNADAAYKLARKTAMAVSALCAHHANLTRTAVP